MCTYFAIYVYILYRPTIRWTKKYVYCVIKGYGYKVPGHKDDFARDVNLRYPEKVQIHICNLLILRMQL